MATRAVVPFSEQSWEQEADGVRALVCQVDAARWAIVEYAPGAGRPEFCDVGHEGYVISGEIEYEFASGGKIVARAGEGFVLPADDLHRGVNHGTVPARLLVIDDPPA
jgi:quercetin dioxygenase-like cupin family protein